MAPTRTETLLFANAVSGRRGIGLSEQRCQHARMNPFAARYGRLDERPNIETQQTNLAAVIVVNGHGTDASDIARHGARANVDESDLAMAADKRTMRMAHEHGGARLDLKG